MARLVGRWVFLKVYLALWTSWFRWGKVALGRLLARVQPRVPWQPHEFPSLEAFVRWWADHAEWVSDPLWGAIDFFPSLNYLAWQLHTRGCVEEDCDGLAYGAAQFLRRWADDGQCYVVTVILDPFQFSSLWEGILKGAHVMCFFRQGREWRVFSNKVLYPDRWPTFASALHANPFCRGRRVLWYERRDANLNLLGHTRVQ